MLGWIFGWLRDSGQSPVSSALSVRKSAFLAGLAKVRYLDQYRPETAPLDAEARSPGNL